MDYKVEVLISQNDVERKVEEMANLISKEYKGKKLLLVGLLRGSVIFLADLARKISNEDVDITLDFMDVSSYGNSMESSREVKILKDLEEEVDGRHILIVEDIVDTGRTLKKVKELLLVRNPASLKICSLLDKPERREVDIEVEFVGFKIPDVFVVGYGIDYAQKHRSLPYIAKIVMEK